MMQGTQAVTPYQPQGFRMPTREELVSAYTSIANAAMQSGRAKQIKGPPVADPNKWPSYDITPKNMMDTSKTVFAIQGELYLRQSGMMPNGIGSIWFDIGPAPMF